MQIEQAIDEVKLILTTFEDGAPRFPDIQDLKIDIVLWSAPTLGPRVQEVSYYYRRDTGVCGASSFATYPDGLLLCAAVERCLCYRLADWADPQDIKDADELLRLIDKDAE